MVTYRRQRSPLNQIQIKGKWLEYIIDSTSVNLTLEEVLKTKIFISGRRIQKITRSNSLFVNNKNSFLKKKMKLKDIVKLRIEEEIQNSIQPIFTNLDIIYEDQWLLIINKVAGLKVYPTDQKNDITLSNGIKYYYNNINQKTGIHFVHRLDTNTSGAIMVAKNSYAHHLLDMQLQNNQIVRRYIAIATGFVEEFSGKIDQPISKLNNLSNKRCVNIKGDIAITNYNVLKRNLELSVLDVTLDTGRTHQIRVHLSHIGHPLIGDILYGGTITKELNRQALHCYELSWIDLSSQQRKTVTATTPKDMENIMNSI